MRIFFFVEALIAAIIVVIFILSPLSLVILGIGGFGPARTVTAHVERLYVDTGRESSYYMVGTDKGVFEVDNGIFLGVWNADEIYSSIKQDHDYKFTTKGNRIVNFWFQQYPYIIKVEEN